MLYRIFLLVFMVCTFGRTVFAGPTTPPLSSIFKLLSSNTQAVCDTRNTSDGGCCVFPFKYKGELYYECTTKNFGNEWCATTDDFDNNPSKWGSCTGKAPKAIFDIILEKNKNLLDGKTALSGHNIELFEGDILVDDDIRRRFINKTTGMSSGSSGRTKRAAIRPSQRDLWKDRSGRPLIPYRIQPSNYHATGNIRRAMSHLKSKVPCLRFVRHSGNMGGRYLSFHDGGGCWSLVGRLKSSGRQLISIGKGCEGMGTIAHEILHALGFWHEQSRPDRDRYVTIKWGNIIRRYLGNFQKQPYSQINSFGVPYDYKSVMHYGPGSFAKPGTKYTIVGKGGRLDFGQRYGLSASDALQLNKLYCGNTGPRPPRPTPRPPQPGCPHKDSLGSCPYWKSVGYCKTSSPYNSYMRKNCKKSCFCNQGCSDSKLSSVCRFWSTKGYCTNARYRSYVRAQCRKTCRVCY